MTMSEPREQRLPATAPEPEPPEPPHVPTPDAEPLARGEATGGAMTQETGFLSAESDPDPFVPAERREIEDPRHRGIAGQLRYPAAEGTNDMMPGAPGSMAGPRATAAASGLTGQMGESSLGFSTTPSAGTEAGVGATELSTLEGGYGSDEGESELDPAYRQESHLPPENDEEPV